MVEEKLPLALPAVLLETRLRCKRPLKTSLSIHASSLFKYHAGGGLVQRFPSLYRSDSGYHEGETSQDEVSDYPELDPMFILFRGLALDIVGLAFLYVFSTANNR